ncbi:DeoR/GlpR family DNA-binding transcription regulator [Caldalkalibacillus mannanilyticus]|uniref:DeoR/GlpR family DNA-binding transcription regulator n=1 Tax=Caldalkalibacillus mannanilyticus TaxID=1418 RepID=UPI00046912D2|nr:DeoR/GlpR family DNA-binding transcription regulator [Caldalkalibacillus mannanilyticus]
MSQKSRLVQILEWLKVQQEISLEEMMNQFTISRDTARRDLVKLEQQGEIVRIKGGAILSSHGSQVVQYRRREITGAKEKIAQKACTYIHDHDYLLLDTSTTVELTAQYITGKGITVVTNSIDIVNTLSEQVEITVYLTGGKFNPFQRNFVGCHTVEELRKYKVDTLFIGACGIGEEGLTSPDEEEAFVKKSMIQAARKVIVLADYTKFEKEFFHKVCGLEDVDVIITDQEPPEKVKQKIEEQQIELVLIHHVTQEEMRDENEKN